MALTPSERQHIRGRRLALASSTARAEARAAAAPPAPLDVDGCEVCGAERPACGETSGCDGCGREFCRGCRGGDSLCRECAGMRDGSGTPPPTPVTDIRGDGGAVPSRASPRNAKKSAPPPGSLDAAAAREWRRLVRDMDVSGWPAHRLDGLRAYCRHAATAEKLTKRAGRWPARDPAGLAKLLAMRDREVRAMLAIAKGWPA